MASLKMPLNYHERLGLSSMTKGPYIPWGKESRALAKHLAKKGFAKTLDGGVSYTATAAGKAVNKRYDAILNRLHADLKRR